MKYFAGVEGGGTNSVYVIMDETGKVVARKTGTGTNGWLVGIPAVADQLVAKFASAKAAAGILPTTPFEALGMCSSGFLQKEPQVELIAALQARDPHLSKSYYVDNDSPGSVFTAAGPAGGVVIICGTGTMAQVISSTGATTNCGGWGHAIGDEGSAYYIASKAIQLIFRALDGYALHPSKAAEATGSPAPPHLPDVSRVHAAMLDYFGVASKDGMLDVFYKDFSKSRIAGFTRVLAEAAREGDAFAASLFVKAGRHLGSMARTLAPHLLPPSSSPDSADVHGLRIVAVGSVWLSFDLFREAFLEAATAPFTPLSCSGRVRSLSLVRLKETSAVGAAWKAAERAGVDLPVDFAANAEVIFEHKSE